MKLRNSIFVALSSFFFCLSVTALAQAQAASSTSGGQMQGPCQQVVEACKAAGFTKGDWKNGDGLFRDCVNPIMQGAKSVPNAKKSLPSVSSDLVNQCKAKHPKFGEGKVGS